MSGKGNNKEPKNDDPLHTELHLRRNNAGIQSNSAHNFSTNSPAGSPSHLHLNEASSTSVPHSEGYLPTVQFQRETGPLQFERNLAGRAASKTARGKGQGESSSQKYAVIRSNKNNLSPADAGQGSHAILPNGRKRSSVNFDSRKFMIGSSRKRDVIGGSNYSRSILSDAKTLTHGPAPEYLRYLEGVDHLFFKACRKFPPEIKDFNPKQKRGLWNAAGRCVYYLGQTESYTFRKFRSGFTYKVVDYLGTPVLTSQGSQWNFGFRGVVSVFLNDGFLLGTMEQDFLGSNYNIKDGQGRVVLTIQAPCYLPAVPYVLWCCKEEFEVCMDDGISEIGKISRSWGDEYPDFDGDLGIEFESEDDSRVKALLLGVYFLIEFQYYKFGGNGVTYFFCATLIVAAFVFYFTNGFGYFPQFHSFFIQPPIVES